MSSRKLKFIACPVLVFLFMIHVMYVVSMEELII